MVNRKKAPPPPLPPTGLDQGPNSSYAKITAWQEKYATGAPEIHKDSPKSASKARLKVADWRSPSDGSRQESDRFMDYELARDADWTEPVQDTNDVFRAGPPETYGRSANTQKGRAEGAAKNIYNFSSPVPGPVEVPLGAFMGVCGSGEEKGKGKGKEKGKGKKKKTVWKKIAF